MEFTNSTMQTILYGKRNYEQMVDSAIRNRDHSPTDLLNHLVTSIDHSAYCGPVAERRHQIRMIKFVVSNYFVESEVE